MEHLAAEVPSTWQREQSLGDPLCLLVYEEPGSPSSSVLTFRYPDRQRTCISCCRRGPWTDQHTQVPVVSHLRGQG